MSYQWKKAENISGYNPVSSGLMAFDNGSRNPIVHVAPVNAPLNLPVWTPPAPTYQSQPKETQFRSIAAWYVSGDRNLPDNHF